MIACGVLLGAGALSRRRRAPARVVALYLAAAVAGGIYPGPSRDRSPLRSRTLDINVLMVVAVAGALALGEWLEAATVVFLFAVAQWLEVRTMERARQAIRALIDLSPRDALVRRNGRERARRWWTRSRSATRSSSGRARRLPLDGVVLTGHSDVNEAPLTGESLPVDKGPGDEVFAGTINGRGALEVRVTRLGRDTPSLAHHSSGRRRRRHGARPCRRSSIDSRGSTRRSCSRWR